MKIHKTLFTKSLDETLKECTLQEGDIIQYKPHHHPRVIKQKMDDIDHPLTVKYISNEEERDKLRGNKDIDDVTFLVRVIKRQKRNEIFTGELNRLIKNAEGDLKMARDSADYAKALEFQTRVDTLYEIKFLNTITF